MTTARDQAARELLAFYREAGIDALLEETPLDRFAGEGATTAPAPRTDSAPPPPERRAGAIGGALSAREREVVSRPALALPPEAAVMAAREAAKSAATLAQLRDARTLRRLRAAHDGNSACLRRRQSAGARHVRGR